MVIDTSIDWIKLEFESFDKSNYIISHFDGNNFNILRLNDGLLLPYKAFDLFTNFKNGYFKLTADSYREYKNRIRIKKIDKLKNM